MLLQKVNDNMNKLTDYELNKRVAKALKAINKYDGRSGQIIYKSDLPDYCNDWSVLMPLAEKYNVVWSRYHSFELNKDMKSDYWITVTDQINSQRALVECLIKVLESLEK